MLDLYCRLCSPTALHASLIIFTLLNCTLLCSTPLDTLLTDIYFSVIAGSYAISIIHSSIVFINPNFCPSTPISVYWPNFLSVSLSIYPFSVACLYSFFPFFLSPCSLLRSRSHRMLSWRDCPKTATAPNYSWRYTLTHIDIFRCIDKSTNGGSSNDPKYL